MSELHPSVLPDGCFSPEEVTRKLAEGYTILEIPPRQGIGRLDRQAASAWSIGMAEERFSRAWVELIDAAALIAEIADFDESVRDVPGDHFTGEITLDEARRIRAAIEEAQAAMRAVKRKRAAR